MAIQAFARKDTGEYLYFNKWDLENVSEAQILVYCKELEGFEKWFLGLGGTLPKKENAFQEISQNEVKEGDIAVAVSDGKIFGINSKCDIVTFDGEVTITEAALKDFDLTNIFKFYRTN